MSSISSVGGAGSAWPDPGASRAARMFAKADTDGNGSIDKTELQSMLDRISSKTGRSLGSADTLMTKMDSNGDGSLSSSELAAGMKSLLPPASTVDFAQQHGHHDSGSVDALFSSLDTNGSGGLDASELNKLLDQVAGTTAAGSSGGTASSGATSTTSAVSTAADAAIFGRLDTDGDGVISKAELAAAISGAGHAQPPDGAAPAPPANAPVGASATSATSAASGTSGTTTTYDPLDTNHDGVVSAQERLAGDVQQLVKAMDTNGDGSISASEVDSFINQLTAAQTTSATASSASTSADSGSGSSEQTAKAAHHGGHHHGQGNLGALGDMVREEYTRAAANYASTDTVSVTA